MTPERAALFQTAQDAVWDDVLRELRSGRKTSHWMWFLFPQLGALGRSPTAKRYGLTDLQDAAAYLDHPVLGPRLVQVADLMLAHAGKPADRILGDIDALKLRSCATLFSRTDPTHRCFQAILSQFYAGRACDLTLRALRPPSPEIPDR